MRLYALLFALLAVGAYAASIPETPDVEKKLPEVDTEDTDSTDQELLDQTNTIKDVENKLRVKPTEVIPVAVIVENHEPSLKISEEDDIERPEPDLNNPGAPQRQLHETQSPEYHEAEQLSALNFKQSLTDAQIILRQGFQGVSDGIQHIYENSEQLKSVQQTINSLRDGFTSQINKLNETIHHLLNPENPNNEKTADDESKASFQIIETGLTALKNDFTRGVKTLSEGVDVVASLKADNESPDSASVAPSAPTNLLLDYLQLLQNTVSNGFYNLTQAVMSQAPGQNSQTTISNSNVQSDTPAESAPSTNPFQNIQNTITGFFNPNTSQPGSGIFAPITNLQNSFQNSVSQFFNPNSDQPNQSQSTPSQSGIPQFGAGPIAQAFQNNPIYNSILNIVRPTSQPATQPTQSPPASTSSSPASTSTNTKPEDQAGESDADFVAPAKSVIDVEQPKETDILKVQQLVSEKIKEDEEESKGRPGSGSNNDGSGVVEEVQKEVLNEELPEEPKKEEVKEEKLEANDKTE